MKRVCILAMIGLALVTPACRHKDDAKAQLPPPHVHVETMLAAQRTVPKTLALSGTLDAARRTDLTANASGRVVRTLVELGQRVERGEALAQLDTRSATLSAAEAEANVASAVAQRDNAAADCSRYEKLIGTGAITQQEYDKTATQCRNSTASETAAQVRAREAQQTVTDATIRAPFAGLVSERFVNVGDYVHADTRVVTLLQDDTLRLTLTVPEANMDSVHEGQSLSFSTVAKPGQSFNAVVRFLGHEVRSTTRDMVLEAEVVNADRGLAAGMFVTAQLATGEEPLPTISKKAVLGIGSAPTVFAVVDGKLQQRAVQLGAALGDDVAVRDGVATGERVMLNPTETTPDGALVD